MWRFIAFMTLHLTLGNTDYIDGPRNTVVLVGHPMEMECLADSSSTVSEWSMLRPFSKNKKTIFLNSKGQRKTKNEHFGIVEGTNGSVVLYTNWTDMDDAGIYTCAVQITLKQPDLYSAHLIVFETEPTCETNLSTSQTNTFVEGTYLWMSCYVSFRGSWAPTIEWRLCEANGETDEEPINLTDLANAEIVPNAKASSTLTIALAATSNSFYYSCDIYFSSVKNSELVTASNSPDYSYRWNSPMVTFLPKPVEHTTQWKWMANDDSANNTNDLKSFSVFNAVYLVAGVAVLFGIASSLVALILCLRLRKKDSAALADLDQTEPLASPYDLIPYAITDGYDSIEEVDETDDVLFPSFPPRQGPLPSPGYSGLTADEPKPPGVYSRMDHKEKSVEDEKGDFDEKKLESDIDGTKSDHSMLSGEGEPTMKTTKRSNSYLDLTTETVEDTEAEGGDIPSAYLKITDDIQPAYLKITDESSQFNTSNKTNENQDPNGYLELISKSDKETEYDSNEIPSAYLRITDDALQATMHE